MNIAVTSFSFGIVQNNKFPKHYASHSENWELEFCHQFQNTTKQLQNLVSRQTLYALCDKKVEKTLTGLVLGLPKINQEFLSQSMLFLNKINILFSSSDKILFTS